MPIQCSTSALSGNSGRVMFKPPSTTYCLLDNTDFPIGTRVGVPASNDYRIGDRVVFTSEGTPTYASDGGSNYGENITYYIVGGGQGNDWIELSTTEGGAAISVTTEGGVATAGVLQNAADGEYRDAGLTAGSGYTNGQYNNVALTTSGSGIGARANITVAGGAVTVVEITAGGSGYADSDTASAADADLGGGGGSGFELAITSSDIATETIFTLGTITSEAFIPLNPARFFSNSFS